MYLGRVRVKIIPLYPVNIYTLPYSFTFTIYAYPWSEIGKAWLYLCRYFPLITAWLVNGIPSQCWKTQTITFFHAHIPQAYHHYHIVTFRICTARASHYRYFHTVHCQKSVVLVGCIFAGFQWMLYEVGNCVLLCFIFLRISCSQKNYHKLNFFQNHYTVHTIITIS